MAKNQECFGFIQFKHRQVPLVCFSSAKYVENAVKISEPADMPNTWLEGYVWEDLDILVEAYITSNSVYGWFEYDLERLYLFVRAFGFKPHDVVYMHVWKSNLSKAFGESKVPDRKGYLVQKGRVSQVKFPHS